MSKAKAPDRITPSKATIDWLLEEDNPAVAVLARTALLGEPESPATAALWQRRNEYAPVARILELMQPDGSWAPPARDYQKYWGSLWQIHILGELYASGDDDRVQAAARYAFSRQLPDGSWSASNMRTAGSIPCLTANVARGLARLGFERDERVVHAIEHCVALYRELGCVNCTQGLGYQLNGYCHMLTPKELLLLAEVPQELWPDGAEELRDACVQMLRDKQVFHSLPTRSGEFQDGLWSLPTSEREGYRERYVAEHGEPRDFGPKPGWTRFGYPLSYNSDALESLWALALHGEPMRPEYESALELVRSTADTEGRWAMRTSFNGKMLADVETKGKPSKWLTLRALRVLKHFLPMAALVLALALAGCTAVPTQGDDAEEDPREEQPGIEAPQPDIEGELRTEPGLYDLSDGRVQVVGTLDRVDLEGGFWAITGAVANDDGAAGTIAVIANGDAMADTLTPLQGTTVSAIGKRQTGPSTRMAGPEVVVESIEPVANLTGG